MQCATLLHYTEVHYITTYIRGWLETKYESSMTAPSWAEYSMLILSLSLSVSFSSSKTKPLSSLTPSLHAPPLRSDLAPQGFPIICEYSVLISSFRMLPDILQENKCENCKWGNIAQHEAVKGFDMLCLSKWNVWMSSKQRRINISPCATRKAQLNQPL